MLTILGSLDSSGWRNGSSPLGAVLLVCCCWVVVGGDYHSSAGPARSRFRGVPTTPVMFPVDRLPRQIFYQWQKQDDGESRGKTVYFWGLGRL